MQRTRNDFLFPNLIECAFKMDHLISCDQNTYAKSTEVNI